MHGLCQNLESVTDKKQRIVIRIAICPPLQLLPHNSNLSHHSLTYIKISQYKPALNSLTISPSLPSLNVIQHCPTFLYFAKSYPTSYNLTQHHHTSTILTQPSIAPIPSQNLSYPTYLHQTGIILEV